MKRSTFKILFVVKPSRVSRNGEYPVFCVLQLMNNVLSESGLLKPEEATGGFRCVYEQ